MLSFILSIALFMAGTQFLKKQGYGEDVIDLLIAGMSGGFLINSVTNMILGIIALNPELILIELLMSLVYLYFMKNFMKKAGV